MVERVAPVPRALARLGAEERPTTSRKSASPVSGRVTVRPTNSMGSERGRSRSSPGSPVPGDASSQPSPATSASSEIPNQRVMRTPSKARGTR